MKPIIRTKLIYTFRTGTNYASGSLEGGCVMSSDFDLMPVINGVIGELTNRFYGTELLPPNTIFALYKISPSPPFTKTVKLLDNRKYRKHVF